MNYTLRALHSKDATRMLEWMKSPLVTEHLRINGEGKTIADTLKFITDSKRDTTNANFAIVDENDLYMGTVSLKSIDYTEKSGEYAIALHCDALGKGVASVASRLILEKAFNEMGLLRVYLNVLADNVRAVRFYEKFGFCYTHTTTMTIKQEEKALLWYEKCRE